jgi:hypothetical protein
VRQLSIPRILLPRNAVLAGSPVRRRRTQRTVAVERLTGDLTTKVRYLLTSRSETRPEACVRLDLRKRNLRQIAERPKSIGFLDSL